jgi:drug/metabolite transporter (DMT)-like permease
MRSKTGYAELGLCGLVWGSIGVLVKQVSVTAPVIVFFRLLLGCSVIVAVFAARGRLTELRLRGRRGLLVADALLLAAHWALFFEAFKRLSVATTILIIYLGPVFIAFGAQLFLGERVERRTIASLALSVAGIALIGIPAWGVKDATGLALAFASAILWAALLLANKRLVETYPPPAMAAWQAGIATLVMAPALVGASGHQIARAAPALLLLGTLHTGITGVLYFRALTVVKAQHAGILAYLEPVSAVVYAWVLLGETPRALTLAGGALVLVAGMNVVVGGRSMAPVAEPVAAPSDVAAS